MTTVLAVTAVLLILTSYLTTVIVLLRRVNQAEERLKQAEERLKTLAQDAERKQQDLLLRLLLIKAIAGPTQPDPKNGGGGNLQTPPPLFGRPSSFTLL